jgi:hypothetical protein
LVKKFSLPPQVEDWKSADDRFDQRYSSMERHKKHLWETAKDGVLDTLPDYVKKRYTRYPYRRWAERPECMLLLGQKLKRHF